MFKMKPTISCFLLLIVCTLLVFQKGAAECNDVCPDGWIRFQGSCYFIAYGQNFSFVESEHYCQQHNSHLIHVDNALENAFIKDFLHKTSAGTSWLGLSDMDIEGVWRWYDNNELVSYTDWYPGQPNKGDIEDCAAFADYHSDHAYLWEDYPCNVTLQPVCEINMCDDPSEIIG